MQNDPGNVNEVGVGRAYVFLFQLSWVERTLEEFQSDICCPVLFKWMLRRVYYLYTGWELGLLKHGLNWVH